MGKRQSHRLGDPLRFHHLSPPQSSPTEIAAPSQPQDLPPQNSDVLGDASSFAQSNGAEAIYTNRVLLLLQPYSIMDQVLNSSLTSFRIYALSFSQMNALVFHEFLFTFDVICRLDNLLVSARMFPDSMIFWCQAALQNAVAEQSNPSSQSSSILFSIRDH
ncbi:hypothetical protein RHGRI_038482 [Rhododendron griersonianum]|uniref:Uncharacterized protein n=1 Tax=Rhododendron griersonianum TaxID=479676 RepID=A0AAV6HN50_9ERIC|nr:hypothetical protein RHGRI_038482 [Rhododendron griersonianum]